MVITGPSLKSAKYYIEHKEISCNSRIYRKLLPFSPSVPSLGTSFAFCSLILYRQNKPKLSTK